MKKTLLIKQPAGIGDIIFCQKIAKHIQRTTEYTEVVWPVKHVYHDAVKKLIAPGINFCDEDSDFPFKNIYISSDGIMQNDELLFISLQNSSNYISSCLCHGNPLAHGHIKYNFSNIDYSDWKEYLEIKRNYNREQELIQMLGIDDTPFTLANMNYGTYPNFLKRTDIQNNSNSKIIYMDFINGIDIFDWMGVFERAEKIHTVETSICYILNYMDLKNVIVYSRYPNINDDFSYMKDHSSQNWTYIN